MDNTRRRIEDIDLEIIRMISERNAAAVQIGRMKVNASLPLRAPAVEERVVARYIEGGREYGISESSASRIARLLIQESISHQELIPRPSSSMRILMIGGNGKMGRWLSELFASRGHDIWVYDITVSDRFPMEEDLGAGVEEADVVVVATPISLAREMLEKVIGLGPGGLVFDIASIKSPFQDVLIRAASDGLRICSLHPMFGPGAESIIGRNVVVCDCGSRDAVEQASMLMDGADVTEIKVEEHDKVMAYVLGLGHAVNIAFSGGLRASGIPFEELSRVASTTFQRQVDTAKDVALENPQLYYEIQRMNPHNAEALASFQEALDDVRAAAEEGDLKAFDRIMGDGREYFGGR